MKYRLCLYFHSRERAESYATLQEFTRYTVRDISNPAHSQFRLMVRVPPDWMGKLA